MSKFSSRIQGILLLTLRRGFRVQCTATRPAPLVITQPCLSSDGPHYPRAETLPQGGHYGGETVLAAKIMGQYAPLPSHQ